MKILRLLAVLVWLASFLASSARSTRADGMGQDASDLQ